MALDRRVLLARARWRAAEERIYPLAMADTAAYQDAVTRVGAVLALLRKRCATEDELLAVDADPGDLLAEAGSIRQDDVIAAACALRSVELAAAASSMGNVR